MFAVIDDFRPAVADNDLIIQIQHSNDLLKNVLDESMESMMNNAKTCIKINLSSLNPPLITMESRSRMLRLKEISVTR